MIQQVCISIVQAPSASDGEVAVAVAGDGKLERKGLSNNPLEVFASVDMAMPKGDSLRLVADFRVVTQQLEAVPWPYHNLEQAAEFFTRASCFAILDLLRGFWQISIGGQGREAFTMVNQEGLLPP